jgi:hydrogenase nickel incorporation protein HypB
MEVKVLQNILSANDQLAARNRQLLNQKRVFTVNIMSSPGAGKTSLILHTIKGLKDKVKIAVIEGDVASSLDAEKVTAYGGRAVQINTDGGCHLDANMLVSALDNLPLDDIELLLIENVGNLICPAEFALGEHKKVMLLSLPEGDDKPYKYPLMFTIADAVVINKLDLLPYLDFDIEGFCRTVKGLNQRAEIFRVSCKTGEGVESWLSWLWNELKNYNSI